MGQSFRHELLARWKQWFVLIPDEWGNHSDVLAEGNIRAAVVLIPDEWGNHSDFLIFLKRRNTVLIPDEWGNHSDRRFDFPEKGITVLIPDEWGNHSDTITQRSIEL